MTRIIVGVDGSEGSAAALRFARRESGLHGWPVTAVLAWGYLDQYRGREPFDPHYDQADAERAVAAMVADAVGADEGAHVEAVAVCEVAPKALIEAARPGDLLVVGARGLGGFKALLLGSVSRQCVDHAPCSVAVVRPGLRRADGAVEHVVVGVDGSEFARAALAWAVQEGRARHAVVQAVHAWSMPTPFGPAAMGPFVTVEDPAPFEEAAARSLDAVVGDADVERVLVNGSAASALLDAATGADLLVVGARGVGGFRGLLMGSVSRQAAEHAPCPVVVVRQAAPRQV